VQKYDEEGFELILNPAFTFLGETLINKPLDDTPVKLEKPIEENNKQLSQNEEVIVNNELEVNEATEEDKNDNANDNNNNKEHKDNDVNEQLNYDKKSQTQEQQQQQQLLQSQIQGEPSVHDDQQQQPKDEAEEEKIEYPHDPNLPTNSDPNCKNAEHPDKILIKDYGKMPSLRKMVYEDEEYPLYEDAIPLYQLAVSGIVPYSLEAVNRSVEPEKIVLKCAEYGADIKYDFTFDSLGITGEPQLSYLDGTWFKLWSDHAADSYKRLSKVSDIISGRLLYHEQVMENVFVSTFENGKVIVNYRDDSVTVGSTVVKAKDFAVLEEAE
jgi:hypothetical protein